MHEVDGADAAGHVVSADIDRSDPTGLHRTAVVQAAAGPRGVCALMVDGADCDALVGTHWRGTANRSQSRWRRPVAWRRCGKPARDPAAAIRNRLHRPRMVAGVQYGRRRDRGRLGARILASGVTPRATRV